MAKWPTHADGRPKKMGEMTPEERREQTSQAVEVVKKDFEDPGMQKRLQKALDDFREDEKAKNKS